MRRPDFCPKCNAYLWGYGFPAGLADPRDYTPDTEVCTLQEYMNWHEDCLRAAEGKPVLSEVLGCAHSAYGMGIYRLECGCSYAKVESGK